MKLQIEQLKTTGDKYKAQNKKLKNQNQNLVTALETLEEELEGYVFKKWKGGNFARGIPLFDNTIKNWKKFFVVAKKSVWKLKAKVVRFFFCIMIIYASRNVIYPIVPIMLGLNDDFSFFDSDYARRTTNYCSTAKSTLHTCLLHISMVTIPSPKTSILINSSFFVLRLFDFANR